MRRFAIPLWLTLAAAGCYHVNPMLTVEDGGADTDTDTDADAGPEYPADGVDVLVVVDNSSSMAEEQALLSTNMYTIVGALVSPLSASEAPPLDSVRVAVVSTDMGMQWGGNPYQEGDGWPGTPPCNASGDDGLFQTYSAGKHIDLQSGVIPCDSSGDQCPSGWECGGVVDGVGKCLAPAGYVGDFECPAFEGSWAETDIEGAPNGDFIDQSACLTALGTGGCGWEQHIVAGSRALHREDQSDFARGDALLLVLLFSDEDDCSVEDNALFATDEVQDLTAPHKLNIACGEHPEHLYGIPYLGDTFLALKGGNPNGVLFAAVVGVPVDGACQGRGDEIGGCLDHEMMQNVAQLETSGQSQVYFHRPACIREEGGVEVIMARPARRIVELAQSFGENGYVYSICNEDWTEAMEHIARMVALEIAD